MNAGSATAGRDAQTIFIKSHTPEYTSNTVSTGWLRVCPFRERLAGGQVITGMAYGPARSLSSLWGPLGTAGDRWGSLGTTGDRWGPRGSMGTAGVPPARAPHVHAPRRPAPRSPAAARGPFGSYTMSYTLCPFYTPCPAPPTTVSRTSGSEPRDHQR